MDVQKPLRRGIFVTAGGLGKLWVPFKYEVLPVLCFGCGKLGHGVKDCKAMPKDVINLPKDSFPYSVALKAETNVRGKEYHDLSKQKNIRLKSYVGRGVDGMIIPMAPSVREMGEVEMSLKSADGEVFLINEVSNVEAFGFRDNICHLDCYKILTIIELDGGQQFSLIKTGTVDGVFLDEARLGCDKDCFMDRDLSMLEVVSMEHDRPCTLGRPSGQLCGTNEEECRPLENIMGTSGRK